MLCTRCSSYMTAEDIVCPECGAPVDDTQEEESGVQAIRQGRRARAAAAEAPNGTTPRRMRRGASHARVEAEPEDSNDQSIPLYGEDGVIGGDLPPRTPEVERAPRQVAYRSGNMKDQVRMPGMEQRRLHDLREKEERKTWSSALNRRWKKEYNPYDVKKHAINWAKFIVGVILAIILAVIGFFVYLTNTADGQRMMVRWGRESTTIAIWEVGEEEMNVGNIDGAIAYFEMAREQDGEDNVNVEGLLLLGSAYEAAGRVTDAEIIYTELYQTIVPTRSEPYTNVIRIMLADGREAEAAELMTLAYEKTGVSAFLLQRNSLLPLIPVVDVEPGLYKIDQTITLKSTQGYDVYYTLDEEAVLPEEGTLVEGPITLKEGIYTLRAVAVNGELVSDPFKGAYKVILPSPQSPKSSLAPNTYAKRQRVWLRPGEENKNDTDITIYYTIDGSIPDADSPIYTGEPFYLPTGGYVTLKAVAVNSYGKVSNQLEVRYKIDCGPYPESSWTSQEGISDLSLYTTTVREFQEKYGKPLSTEEWWVTELNAFGEKHTYSWGYIIVGPKQKETVLVELFFTDKTFTAPRSTGIGDSEKEIVGKYRDMNQVESPSGNRGLYSNNNGTAKIWVVEDGKEIRYTTPTAESHKWCLTYKLDKNGVCRSIHWYFEY